MSMSSHLQCGDKCLDLSTPQVMGILNITPDSFSDGGQFINQYNHQVMIDKAIDHAANMVVAGAAIIDVGGESTRPGAKQLTNQEELDRVLPVIEKLLNELNVIVSIDTSNPVVIEEAIKLGVHFINDVRALSQPGALELLSQSNLPICLMHMLAEPDEMQNNPCYDNVVNTVFNFLEQRVQTCIDAGIEKNRLLIDPGFGFGKTVEHNLQLLNQLENLNKLGLPILVGLSRKQIIGAILDKPVTHRLYGSLAAAVIAVINGASIVRTHDVAPTVDAIKVAAAVMSE